jgi:hypothetical protein
LADAEALERTIAALRADIALHCETCMVVLDKSGNRVPLAFNRAQRFIHAQLEEQRRQTGKVRAIILKGRQQGASTYIGGRFYCLSSMHMGRNALIVAHEQKATDNLFKMVRRFHEHNPFKPSTSATNAKELVFDKLDGGYKLATAGTKDVARGNTAQVAHLSEFAFWDNAETHLAGLGNTVPDADGTEIVIESTANGIGNKFHTMWQDAEAGIGEFIPVFVSWHWQDEYRASVPAGFGLSAADQLYMDTFGLDLPQMAWRANKLATYGQGFEWLFDQEFPATPGLAFRTSTNDPLISPTVVMAAVTSGYRERAGAFIIACDPAEYGADRTAVAFRHGRTVHRIEYHSHKGTMEVAGMLADYWREHQPDALFVDKIGIGSGIVDRLKELNIPVIGVNSAERAADPERYGNKRAEMWYRMRDWLQDTPCRLPHNMALIADLSAPSYKYTSNGSRLIESKDDMRKRQVRSPDGADAVAMTFAEPVVPRALRDERGALFAPSRTAATSAGY